MSLRRFLNLGIGLCFAGYFTRMVADMSHILAVGVVGVLLWLIGIYLWLRGCFGVAKSKGYHPAIGLIGLGFPVFYVALLALPNKLGEDTTEVKEREEVGSGQ